MLVTVYNFQDHLGVFLNNPIFENSDFELLRFSGLLNQKIEEVRNRNFQKSEYSKKRQDDLDNPNFENYTLSLTYTSLRCSNVATNIHKILRQFTPNYKLEIVFSTIKLDNVIHPRLKPQKKYFHNCNLC